MRLDIGEKPEIVFTEPFFVPDVMITDLAYAQHVSGDLYRLGLASTQTRALDGSVEHVISHKTLISPDTVWRITTKFFRMVGYRGFLRY